MKKLNYSTDAQEVELFPQGTYDSRDVDSDKLATTLTKNGSKSLVENRQQYSLKYWKKAVEDIALTPEGEKVSCDELFNVYTVRAPINHGLCRQPKCLPAGSRLQFEMVKNFASKILAKHNAFQECRMLTSIFERLTTDKYSFSNDLELEEKTTVCRIVEECKCAELVVNYPDMVVKQLKEGRFYTPVNENVKSDAHGLFDKEQIEGKTGVLSYKYWQPHTTTIKVLKTQTMKDETDKLDYTIFYKKKDKHDHEEPNITDHMLESVYCTPGGCVDFFEFQNENWCVPMKFDDRAGKHGLVTVKITFAGEINGSWDAFVTKIPVEDLILDKAKNEALVDRVTPKK
ncbi:Oidioi.mRNA.OKI2018_I69.chr1.g1346.t1.cds [Oikopleura dioica]|uniref:Oidioi.mRNA.OKI2018_I69.chr1.g1346.t1.cds n=1 Tax=Oikopleura dioica TaxID=34765 RepID=A0ABN7SMM3_OIKDI|nr:Oidioi.mRNA.OKI2018_I69.chr1.g1346.t1.cds [Oikopleura dioica]